MKKISVLIAMVAVALSASAFKQLSITELETLLQKNSQLEAERYLTSMGWSAYKQTTWNDADMPAPAGSVRYAYSYQRSGTTEQAQGWAHIVAVDSLSAPVLVDTKNWDSKAYTTFTTGMKSRGYKLYKTYKMGPGTVSLYTTDRYVLNIFEWTNGSRKERVISLYAKGSISDREYGEKTVYDKEGKRLMTFNLIKGEIKGPVTVYQNDKPLTAMTWKYSGAFSGNYFLPNGSTTPVENNIITNMYMRNDGQFVALDSLQSVLIKKITPDTVLNHFEYTRGMFTVPFLRTGYEYPDSTNVYFLKEKSLTGNAEAQKLLRNYFAEYNKVPAEYVKNMKSATSNSYSEAIVMASTLLHETRRSMKNEILSKQMFSIHNQQYALRSADTAQLAKQLSVMEDEVNQVWLKQEAAYRENFVLDSLNREIAAREARMQTTLSTALGYVLKASSDTVPFKDAMTALLADRRIDWKEYFQYNDNGQLVKYLMPLADMADYKVIEVAPELNDGIVDVLLNSADSQQSVICRMVMHMDKGLIDARGLIAKEELSNLEQMRAKLEKGMDSITVVSKYGCADVLKTYRLQYSLIDRTTYFKDLAAYELSEARLTESLKLQSACLEFMTLRQQIAQMDADIRTELKNQKDADKAAAYKALYKTFDLAWPANAKSDDVCVKLQGYLQEMKKF